MKTKPIKKTPELKKHFEKYVNKKGKKCWIWTGAKSGSGPYGYIMHQHQLMRAHRVSFALFNGDLISGLTIDHLCKNTICVNPKHLEQVTMRENVVRSEGPCAINMRKTKCPKGHIYDFVTSRGVRMCRQCRRTYMLTYQKLWRAKKKDI